jgi:hypothetical protein
LGESGRRRLREKPKGSGTVRTVIPDIGWSAQHQSLGQPKEIVMIQSSNKRMGSQLNQDVTLGPSSRSTESHLDQWRRKSAF